MPEEYLMLVLIDVSEQAIRYRLEKLQHDGIITRKGSTESREWVIKVTISDAILEQLGTNFGALFQ